MSFFKDFKEDLSQAVNELVPEEASKESLFEGAVVEEPMKEELKSEDIADLLKNLDSVPAEESVIAEAPQSDNAFDSFFADVEAAAKEAETPVMEAAQPAVDMMAAAMPVVEAPVMETPVVEATEAVAPVEEAPVMEEPVPIVEAAAADVSVESTSMFASELESKEEAPAMESPIFAENTPVAETPVMSSAPIFSQQTKEPYVPTPYRNKETGLITFGMTVVGDIKVEGSLEIQGKIKGNIDVDGKLDITGIIEGNSVAEEIFADGAKINGEIKSTGTVKIGKSTIVKGNITATSAVIAGAVKGDIDIQGPVILDSTAIIMGNIKSKTIQINNGAAIEGLCSQCYADLSPSHFFEENENA